MPIDDSFHSASGVARLTRKVSSDDSTESRLAVLRRTHVPTLVPSHRASRIDRFLGGEGCVSQFREKLEISHQAHGRSLRYPAGLFARHIWHLALFGAEFPPSSRT